MTEALNTIRKICAGHSCHDGVCPLYNACPTHAPVIVYGASDDLMEFDGAIRDETGCFEGGVAWVNRNRIMDMSILAGDKAIKAIWCGSERDKNGRQITWTYETEIPHETFLIYEDGEPYCRGIVFHVDDAG